MIEDQWWPPVEDYPVDQEDHWPDGDPDSKSLTMIEAIGTVFHEFVEKLREGFVHVRPEVLVVSPALDKRLKAAGYHAPYVVHDEMATYLWPTKEIKEAAAGKKTLKNGREMPIVLRGTGPHKEPFKNRGKK